MRYLGYYGTALLGMSVATLIKSRQSGVEPKLENIILLGIMITAIWLIAEGFRRYIKGQ